ncbi:MAG TPA: hypothetical protein VIL30_14380 [Ramlibacter sp.]
MSAPMGRLARWLLVLALLPLAWTAPARAEAELPESRGLPVVVRAALGFVQVEAFDDAKGTFEATTDLRMTWHDGKQAFEAVQPGAYRHYRASGADAALAQAWSPQVRYINRVGEPTFVEPRLKVFADGTVELVVRTTATYKVPVDLVRFPFDRQGLVVQVAMKEATVEEVDLDFSEPDVEFSKASREAALEGWRLGLVNLRRDLVSGGNGYRYPVFSATLEVRRVAAGTAATIFIPLFASLLIPFLATWMNRSNEGEFEVDAFELANVIIGGLFAVIALNFSVGSAYPSIVASDNTVTRLIGLNYVALAVGLIITVVFYRYGLPRRWFGAYVQHEAFRFLTWAFPLVFVTTGLLFVLMAAA